MRPNLPLLLALAPASPARALRPCIEGHLHLESDPGDLVGRGETYDFGPEDGNFFMRTQPPFSPDVKHVSVLFSNDEQFWSLGGRSRAATPSRPGSEPSWSFLYRKMIPVLTAAGLRAVVPDLVGFGRSDKYARLDDYSYQMQVDVMAEWVRRLDLRRAVFFGQDWGGLIGLRVEAEDPERFGAVVAANTGLPDASGGRAGAPVPFLVWRFFSRWTPVFPTSRIVDAGTVADLPDAVRAAYEAPFPTRRHQAGARIMPSLVPIRESDPAIPANRRAWEVLERWEKPFLTAFSDRDPITRGLEKVFQERVPGAKGQPHVTIEGAGHFLQEDRGEALAQVIVDLVRRLPSASGPITAGRRPAPGAKACLRHRGAASADPVGGTASAQSP